MADAVPEFEPTNSWCYRFSRYHALPEIMQMPEVVDGKPFRLIELSRRILDTHLSPEQQAATFTRAKAGDQASIASTIKFYIPFLAKETGQLINLGAGMFRLPTAEDIDQDEVEDAAIEAGEEEAGEFDGWIYAFSFPVLVRHGGPYPIKVGRTSGEVQARVISQCKGSATFDNPVIVGQWKAKRVGSVELAVHNVLKARGKWRENVPGTEWFDTTVAEVEAVIKFIAQ